MTLKWLCFLVGNHYFPMVDSWKQTNNKKKDLQALTLVEPTKYILELDPLAAPHLDNRLYIFAFFHIFAACMNTKRSVNIWLWRPVYKNSTTFKEPFAVLIIRVESFFYTIYVGDTYTCFCCNTTVKYDNSWFIKNSQKFLACFQK